ATARRNAEYTRATGNRLAGGEPISRRTTSARGVGIDAYDGGMAATTVRLQVNRIDRAIEADAGALLVDVLRNSLGLKGTRFGCGTEQCGACMVLVDGKPQCSCTMPVVAAAGRSVTTVEGLGTRDSPHPLQRAFI